jgi:hypothetical protein
MKYTYRYIDPTTCAPFRKTIRYTRGQFIGWTPRMGLPNVHYAIFRRKADEILIPQYDVTAETLQLIGPPKETP